MLRYKQISLSRRRLRQRLRASQMRSVQWRAGPEAVHSNFHPEDGVHVRDSRLKGQITRLLHWRFCRTLIWVRQYSRKLLNWPQKLRWWLPFLSIFSHWEMRKNVSQNDRQADKGFHKDQTCLGVLPGSYHPILWEWPPLDMTAV